jgi:predicted AlkP superfamily phosphohydrolase/phosphomutase
LPSRILFVGFDSLDKDLLVQWADQGLLPNFQALLKTSTYGATENPPGLYGGSLWPSFATGLSPARHHRFFQLQARAGQYAEEPCYVSQIEGENFWEAIGEQDRRMAILDMPMARLSSRLNGIQLADWSTHDPEYGGAVSYPPALVDELRARFGDPMADRCDKMARRDYRSFLRDLQERMQQKLDLSLHLLASQQWDFFATVFSEAHCVGHHCWHLHDPTHPRHDGGAAAEIGDPLRDMYQALDRTLGRILEEAGRDAQTVVLASHGMGPLYNEYVLMDEIVRRLDAASRTATPRSGFRGLKRLWYALPAAWRESRLLQSAKAKWSGSLRRSLLVADRSSSLFYAVPLNPDVGAVRINLAGRQPQGRVQPGEEYRDLCEQLRGDLSAMVNGDTGRPVLSAVHITRDIYQGPYADEIPDVIVEWSRTEPVRSIDSPKIGRLKIPRMLGRTGDHRSRGMFFIHGPGVPAGPAKGSVSIMDFAPTIALLLGVRLENLDGKPIAGLIGY